MKSLNTKNKYLSYDFTDSQKIIADVKDYIRKYECPELTLNLEKLNIMDAAKILIMTSTYHNNKYPEGKLICKTQSAIKNFISNTPTKNLEFIV